MDHMIEQGDSGVKIVPSIIKARDVKSKLQSNDPKMNQRFHAKDQNGCLQDLISNLGKPVLEMTNRKKSLRLPQELPTKSGSSRTQSPRQ